MVVRECTGPNGIKGAFNSGGSMAYLLFGIFIFVRNLILAIRARPKNDKDSTRDDEEITQLNL